VLLYEVPNAPTLPVGPWLAHYPVDDLAAIANFVWRPFANAAAVGGAAREEDDGIASEVWGLRVQPGDGNADRLTVRQRAVLGHRKVPALDVRAQVVLWLARNDRVRAWRRGVTEVGCMDDRARSGYQRDGDRRGRGVDEASAPPS
jgi:hypothetical protein